MAQRPARRERVSAKSSPTASAAASSSRRRPSSTAPDATSALPEDRQRDDLHPAVRDGPRQRERLLRHAGGDAGSAWASSAMSASNSVISRARRTARGRPARPARRSQAAATASSPRKSRWSEPSHIAIRAAPHGSPARGKRGTPARARPTSPPASPCHQAARLSPSHAAGASLGHRRLEAGPGVVPSPRSERSRAGREGIRPASRGHGHARP